MAKLTVDMSIESIQELLAQLQPQELLALLASMQDRLETFQMMKLAELSFSEWATEEDLYPLDG